MVLRAEPTASESDPLARVVASSRYRAHLDGLRCLAISLAVLFHSGVPLFADGFVGVDIFFVLSGFLVTQVLLRDLGGGGSVRYGRFYARRFRRLLPAAFAALIGTALVFAAIEPLTALRALDAFQASFLYVANWYFIGESTQYFGEVAANPVLQFWSLAVEEQFYVVWPVAFGALVVAARRWTARRALLVIRVVVGAAALASLAWALHLRTENLDRAYFGTDARAYELLLGASIALVPDLVPRLDRFRRPLRAVAVLALVTLVALGSSVGDGDVIVRAAVTAFVVAVAIVAMECEGGGPANRFLSWGPFVYLGKVSYGTYLWHWPLILVLEATLDLGPLATAMTTAVLATGLASLSFQVLEQPIRISRLLDRHRFAVIGTALVTSVVAAVVLVPLVVEPRAATAPAAAAAVEVETGTPVPEWFDYVRVWSEGYGAPVDDEGAPISCVGLEPERCTVVRGRGPHVLLMGDSTAEALYRGFAAAAEAHDFTLSILVAGGCPWARDLYGFGTEIRARCQAMKEDAYTRVIPALDPDVIVVSSAGDIDGIGLPDEPMRTDDPELARAMVQSLRDLAGWTRTVIVVEPFPVPEDEMNPLECLAGAEVVEECRYVAHPGPTWYEQITRAAAADDPRIVSADLDRLACPFLPICDPIIGDLVVKGDHVHLTAEWSASLADPIAAYLRDHGALP